MDVTIFNKVFLKLLEAESVGVARFECKQTYGASHPVEVEGAISIFNSALAEAFEMQNEPDAAEALTAKFPGLSRENAVRVIEKAQKQMRDYLKDR